VSPGDRAVKFINRLTHTGDFAGAPFDLRRWQKDIVKRLFGTVRKDGLRQYRKCFLALPRKQGKTELAAAILLYLLLGTGKRGQNLYSASGDRAQASLIFKAAASMVENDVTLSRVCTVYHGYKKIVCEPLDSSYEALSSDAPRKHGLGPSAVLFDEVHVLPNRELHDVLTTGFAARREPLTLYITTAGWDRQSLCYELWDYARKVRDGVIVDPTFLPILYEAAADADWRDEKVWREAMPALGDFCSVEFLREECQKAQELPTCENTFRQLYLNQWTQQAVRWLPMEKWRACDGGTPKHLGDLPLVCGPCYMGLDLSTTTDLSALAMAFPRDDGSCDVRCRFWAPEEGAKIRERRDRVPYLTWARQGFLTLTPGDVIDYDAIRHEINELAADFEVRKLLLDPYNATQLGGQLQEDGLPVEFLRQGFLSLSAPTKELERLVLAGKLRHGGHPVLTWCADNAVVERDAAGNVKLSKRKSTERIDGVAALVNAIAAATAGGDGGPSVYETRGLLAV
jgi:phage terminase large subunit-like protein